MKTIRTALCLLVLTLVAASPAHAQSAGWIRLAHLSPDAFDVDVYVAPFRGGNQIVLKKVGYGDVSEHQRLAPGRYTVSMRKAGAPASTPAILSKELTVAEGKAYTVAGMGMAKNLRLDVIQDELSIPPSGQSRVRVIQASSKAARAKVTVGKASAGAVPFASTSSYLHVTAGRVPVNVQPEGSADTSKQNVELSAGAVYSLALLDAPGSGIRVVRLLDAAGAGNTPGDVNAGFGGAAPSQPGGTDTALVVAAGLLLGTGVAFGVVRRRRP